MVSQRLFRLFEQRETAQGDDLFGEYDLVDAAVKPAPVKRVAVLTEAFLPKVDGVSKTTYLTVRYLQQTGREVLIFAPDTSVPRVGDSEVVALPSISIPGAEETRLALPTPTIAKRLRAFKPDLIHLCSPALYTVEGMAAARNMNIPVVANYQTDLPRYAHHYGAAMLSTHVRDWLRYVHNGCHINLVPSRTVRNELQQQGYRRLHIWGRGVNLSRFNPAKRSPVMRRRLLAGRDPNSLLCIYVGRLANEKCVHMLRKMADVPGVALTIIGDGAQREELETLFAGTNTHFTGYLFGEELSTAFASADAFFFPGAAETFGQVVQEAMASGLPVVATELGSVGDLIMPGETGFVVPHDQEAFAAAAERLARNPYLTRRMSFRTRQFAETRPWSAIMSQLETHYSHALSLTQRFSSLIGQTTYHHTAGTRSVALSIGVLIAANVWQNGINLRQLVNSRMLPHPSHS